MSRDVARYKRRVNKKPRSKVARLIEVPTLDEMINGSTIKHLGARSMLANSVCVLHETLRKLGSKETDGSITATEREQMAPISSNLKRNLEAMGLIAKEEDDGFRFGEE